MRPSSGWNSAIRSGPSFYAPGDVADREFKQAISGVAEGVVAACRAFQDLKNESECACADEATSRSAHHREHRSGI